MFHVGFLNGIFRDVLHISEACVFDPSDRCI